MAGHVSDAKTRGGALTTRSHLELDVAGQRARCEVDPSARSLRIWIVIATRTPTTSPALPVREETATESDVELVRRAARGEGSALGALYDRYASLVLAIAARALSPIAEAEDLTQDVFLELWREAHRYDPSRGNVRGWILTKTRSRALDRRLQGARRRRAADRSGFAEGNYLMDERIGSERRALREAFEKLPAAQRTVLELVYAEGLSTNEVADNIGTPVGTVKSRLAYGLARLRASLRAPSAMATVARPRDS